MKPSKAETILSVRVTPKASRSEIVALQNGSVKIYVPEPPSAGKANAAVLKLLAKRLGVPKTSMKIVRGETSRDKEILVPLKDDALQLRLQG